MATYSKPQVSILNGIVMGGGAGASMHGRFRVATENSVFAMPETALGLFPDVGASYFLSRLPGFFGEYVGLTGSRLDGAEMLACGLATHFVPSPSLSSLEEALCKLNSTDPATISANIDGFSEQPTLKERSSYCSFRQTLHVHMFNMHRGRKHTHLLLRGKKKNSSLLLLDIINKCFSRRTIEEIIAALEKTAVNSTDDWISSTIKSLKTASPTSLKISLRSIREGRHQGVGQCLVREYRMVCNVMSGEISKDFFEGCRAILFDKDKNPKWEPSKLEFVTDNMVDRYFSKVEYEDWEDLKLPTRPNLPVHAIAKL
ncbi:3-hydroxyisobutyryl-CoA hydrolase 1 isoform X3 [Diospyros lotus]|nr:3-hydroxyisobutyryl-CoA hydrolase 1 isoform X3 [Diospyros lotus]